MSVIVLDDICNLSCDYCFYSSVLWEKRDELIKAWKIDKDLIYFNKDYVKWLADKFVDSNFEIDLWRKSVVISWWEPTMHPDFCELMTYFIQKWLTIHLITNFVFPTDWQIAKFLKKNIKHFRFLVNFNEIDRQKAAEITKQNLINIDTEHTKMWINLYHADYHFEYAIDVLKNTKHLHTIRFSLPNSQVDEWINMGVIKWMKEVWYFKEDFLDKYKKDLFQDDYDSILNTWKWITYWLLDENIYKYYYEYLWKELEKFIQLIKDNNLQDRVDFYVDCWFDYKIIPETVLWFVLQRLHYKNPCSIPNWVCIQTGWAVQQCYSIWTYWNFTEQELTTKWKSIRELNNYYLISSLLLQFWLLNQIYENKFEMCRWNNLRFFKQIFTKWTFNKWNFILKDYNISQRWDEKVWYMLKDVKELTDKYLDWYKQTKNKMFLIRIYQLIEYCFAHFYIDEVWTILNKMITIMWNDRTKDRLNFFLYYYNILYSFIKNLIKYTNENNYDWIEKLRENSLKEIEELENNWNERICEQPSKQLYKLSNIIKTIIKKQIYIK